MALSLIGYWKVSLHDAYPFPQEVELDLASGVRAQTVRYLESGIWVAGYRGHSYCRYGCGANGSAELSDGDWIWPSGLAHYVQVHGVGLPSEFIAHACRPHAQPLLEPPRSSTRTRWNESLWVTWGKQYRSPMIEELLVAARASAATRCESALQAKAEQFERERGLADEACLRAGCSRRAIHGMALCAWCVTEQDRELISSTTEHQELSRLLAQAPWSANA